MCHIVVLITRSYTVIKGELRALSSGCPLGERGAAGGEGGEEEGSAAPRANATALPGHQVPALLSSCPEGGCGPTHGRVGKAISPRAVLLLWWGGEEAACAPCQGWGTWCPP